METYGVIVEVQVEGRRPDRPLTLFRLCEMLSWQLPQGCTLAGAEVSGGVLRLKFVDPDPALVPRGEAEEYRVVRPED